MTYQDRGYKGEKSADVVSVDANTLLVNVQGLDANGKNAFLYFGTGPLRVPVIGCVTKPGKVTPKKNAVPEVPGKEEVRLKDGTLKTPAIPYKSGVPEVPESKGPDTVTCGPVIVAASSPAPDAGSGKNKQPNTILSAVDSTPPAAKPSEAQNAEKLLNVPVRIQ